MTHHLPSTNDIGLGIGRWYRTNDDYGSWYPNSPRRKGLTISPRFGYEGPGSSYISETCEHCPIHCATNYNSEDTLVLSIKKIESKMDRIENDVVSLRKMIEEDLDAHGRKAKSPATATEPVFPTRANGPGGKLSRTGQSQTFH